MSRDIGFEVNGLHTWRDFGLHLLERHNYKPKRQEHRVKATYSNVTLNFDKLYGKPTYEDRKLVYVFEVFDFNHDKRRALIDTLQEWLDLDEADLYDDFDIEYHYRVFPPDIEAEDIDYGVTHVTITFMAYPFRIPNSDLAYPVDESYYPDLDGDGSVTALDALMIQEAAANVGAGEPSGLTPEQERRADADRDGEITASDAQLVLEFSASAGGGDYTDDPKGWTAFLNDQQGRKPEVI